MKANKFVISTECLTKSYGDVHALKSLDLQVPENSIFGFLGPNGAGKTTAIKLLAPFGSDQALQVIRLDLRHGDRQGGNLQ